MSVLVPTVVATFEAAPPSVFTLPEKMVPPREPDGRVGDHIGRDEVASSAEPVTLNVPSAMVLAPRVTSEPSLV